MNKYKNHIAGIIAVKTGIDAEDVVRSIEIPPSDELGDLAFPCFSLAKSMRKAPQAIASELKSTIKSDVFIERIESNGPYLNFFFNHASLISDVLSDISSSPGDFGKSSEGSGKTVVLEYSSPNIAKPFGIGHLRSTVIGASLARIYRYLGYEVVRINHLGDWGTQFGKLLYAFKKWGDESKLQADPIAHLYDIYVKVNQEEESDPEMKTATREEFKKLESGDKENLALWKRFSDLSKGEFAKIYELLGIEFDSEAGESFYIDKIPSVEETLNEKGLATESREATVIDLEKYGMPPVLLRKRDDTTLYATRDLAAAIFRKTEYNFHKMIYVVGVAQSLYFNQLFKALELMDYDWAADCYHVSFGWIKLGDEMMSTRRGNIVFLEDVIAKTVEKVRKIIEESSPDLPDSETVARQVGIGAVVFADLAYKRDTDISFDWDRMLDFKGNSGPYLQYSHARIKSVIRKYDMDFSGEYDPGLLVLPEEYQLAKRLAAFPDIIVKAAEEFEPQIISSFLLELCGLFNTYYQKYRSPEDRILSSNGATAKARVVLTNSIGNILRSGLEILGLSAPEMM